MCSTYLAGVFLTICTYEGPQLVYHYYDDQLTRNLDNDKTETDEEFQWSEIDVSDEESLVTSRQSSPRSQTLPSSTITIPISRLGDSNSMPKLSFPLHKRPSTGSDLGQELNNLNVSETLQELPPEGSTFMNDTRDTVEAASTGGVAMVPKHLSGHYDETRNPYPCGLDKDILAEILTPPENMCNEKFSLSVDDCMFVGIPVHILESGTWRPLKNKPEFKETALKSDFQRNVSEDDATSGEYRHDFKSPDSADTRSLHDKIGRNDDEIESDKDLNSKDAPGQSRISSIITEKDSPMRMFHVSFALVPPMTKASECEDRIYHSILVPFIRMLRHEQACNNYVWTEVAKILKVQESINHLSVKEQQKSIELVSELATALRNMCTAVSNMDIARIVIGGKARTFQVPLKLELEQLPNWYDDVSPHAYVSTSNSAEKEITHDNYSCYGLLLLDDPEVIVQEINVDPQGPVAAMIRNIHPTSSLEELSKSNNIDINQIINLVWSLVYWRRARIIIPLNAKYTYAVSPLAPLDYFQGIAKTYHSLFPMMPPLQRMLALLSTGKPKPYSMHIPSNDHKHIYMQTLSWLLQNDFVIHLQTFALVFVSKKIKFSSMIVEEVVENGSSLENPKTSECESRSRRNSFQRSNSSHRELENLRDSVIHDPRNTSEIEKRWLSQIALSGATRNPDLAVLFQKLVKYFNGKDCLEQVMIFEKISRDDMRKFIQEFSQYVVTYKHW